MDISIRDTESPFATLEWELGTIETTVPNLRPWEQALTISNTNFAQFWKIGIDREEYPIVLNNDYNEPLKYYLARIGFHHSTGLLTLYKENRYVEIDFWPDDEPWPFRLKGSCVMVPMPESKRPDNFKFSIKFENIEYWFTLRYENNFACQSLQNLLRKISYHDAFPNSDDDGYHKCLWTHGFAGQKTPNSMIDKKFLLFRELGGRESGGPTGFDWLLQARYAAKIHNGQLYQAMSFLIHPAGDAPNSPFITQDGLKSLNLIWKEVERGLPGIHIYNTIYLTDSDAKFTSISLPSMPADIEAQQDTNNVITFLSIEPKHGVLETLLRDSEYRPYFHIKRISAISYSLFKALRRISEFGWSYENLTFDSLAVQKLNPLRVALGDIGMFAAQERGGDSEESCLSQNMKALVDLHISLIQKLLQNHDHSQPSLELPLDAPTLPAHEQLRTNEIETLLSAFIKPDIDLHGWGYQQAAFERVREMAKFLKELQEIRPDRCDKIQNGPWLVMGKQMYEDGDQSAFLPGHPMHGTPHQEAAVVPIGYKRRRKPNRRLI